MFTAKTSWHSTALALFLSGALLGAGPAFAQDTCVEPSIPSVNVSVAPQRDMAFTVEMTLASAGRIRGSLLPHAPGSPIAGKSSAVRATADSLKTLFGTQWHQETAHGAVELGTLSVEVEGTAPASGRGGDGLDIILFDIADVAAGPLTDEVGHWLTLRYEPASATEQLRCDPAQLCTTPAPGEPLEAFFPVPEPGETLDENLTVTSNERSISVTSHVTLKTYQCP